MNRDYTCLSLSRSGGAVTVSWSRSFVRHVDDVSLRSGKCRERLPEVCGWQLVSFRMAQQKGTHARDPGAVLALGSGTTGVGYTVLPAVVEF